MIRWSGAITNRQPVLLSALWLALVAGAAEAAPPAQKAKAAPTETIRYVMRPGDNLYLLAGRYFTKQGDYLPVARLNHVARPRAIPVGTALHIPVALLRYEPLTARIVAARGDVRLRTATGSGTAATDTILRAGDTLETGADGFVSIELPNGTCTSLPTRSSLRITALRRFLLTNSIDYDLEVTAGKAETQATHLPPAGGQVRIRTPRAVSAVRGTKFRVGYADDSSTTEVLDGTVAAGAAGGAAQPITQGYGAAISATGDVHTEELLPAPQLLRPGKVQVDPDVALSFAPVSGAKAYHIQIAADAGFVDVFAEQTTDRPNAVFGSIPDGSWFVRLSAIAPSGLEGKTETTMLRRVLASVSASGGGDSNALRFRWSGTGGSGMVYRFQLYRDKPEGVPMIDEPGLRAGDITLSSPGPGIYYWRVSARRFTPDGPVDNWPPFEKLLVAAPDSGR